MASKNFTPAKIIFSVMFLLLAVFSPRLENRIDLSLGLMEFFVILCGISCGSACGAVVGALTPFLHAWLGYNSFFSAMNFVSAFEFAVYAFVAGMLYKKLNKNIFMYFVTVVTALVSGKVVWGIVMFIFILLDWASGTIGFALIWNNTVANCYLGILLQIAALPFVVNIFKKNRLILN